MSNTEAGHTINLSGGEWIIIRPRRGFAAGNKIDTSGARVIGVDGDDKPVIGIDAAERGVAVLEHAIMAWSLDETPGPAAYRSDDFDYDLGDEMVREINAYYAGQRRTREGKSS